MHCATIQYLGRWAGREPAWRLRSLPLTARRIDAGEALPSDADAVLPLDAVTLRGHRAEAVAAVTAGEGVLPNGGDATPRTPLRRAIVPCLTS